MITLIYIGAGILGLILAWLLGRVFFEPDDPRNDARCTGDPKTCGDPDCSAYPECKRRRDHP